MDLAQLYGCFTPTVVVELVLLSHSARLGARGEGLALVLATLAVLRVSVAGASIGLAQAAPEEATRHARTRVQSGRPLARLGPVAQLLADSWTEIEMARLLTYRAAQMAQTDPGATIEHSSMATLAASETAGRFVEQSPAVWQQMMAVNVTAPMLLAQAVGRTMLAQGSGKIINVASTSGILGKATLVAYSSSRGALLQFTKALATEWPKSGVQVDAIAPGAVYVIDGGESSRL